MKLLNRRRTMNTDTLPYLSRVEYLENSPNLGLSYITLDYIPQGGDIDIEIEFMPVSFGNYAYNYYFIAYTDANTQGYLMQSYNHDNNAVNIRNGNTGSMDIKNVPVKVGEKNFLRMEGVARKYYLNDVEGDLNGVASKINTGVLKLIGKETEQSNSAFWCIYYFKLWKSNELIFDLIPVRKQNEGLMFNRVNGEFYGNQGTGRFIIGPEVETIYDAEVEYLEVNEETGQAWIDALYIPTGDDINLKFKFTLNGYENFVSSGIPWVLAKSNGCNAYGIQSYPNANYINGACGRIIRTDRWKYVNENYPLTFTFNLKFDSATVNGTEWINYTLQDVGAENTESLKIFSYLDGSYVKGKIYYVQLSKNEKPILDLIPVRKDGIGYMYNKIDGKLYGNVGKEDSYFIIGPDKN